MARKTIEQRLAELDVQRATLKARLNKQERGQDTRRKVLAGALVLDMMERDEATRQRFTERLDKYLTRADDRALFGLPERAEPPAKAAVQSVPPERK